MKLWLCGLLLAVLGSSALSQTLVPGPVKLKPGDVVGVVVTAPSTFYGGDYPVLTDGAIYGLGFDRLMVSGKTIPETQVLVRRALRVYVKPEFIFVTLKKQREDVVYIIGPEAPGPIPYFTPVTVRMALGSLGPREAGHDPTSNPMNNPDTFQVDLIRGGKRLFRVVLSKLLNGTDPNASELLKANDILAILPQEIVRVWVTGDVKKAGLLQLPAGSSVYEALATAGGPAETIDTDVRFYLRRGPESRELPVQDNPQEHPVELENGDVLTVVVPVTTHITVLGEVKNQGDLPVKTGTTIVAAIGKAGGVIPTGTLSSVRVFRGGEMLTFDLSEPLSRGPLNQAQVEPGDLIYVDRNERFVYIFGQVNKPGKVLLEDRKIYRLADVVGLANGLTPQGTLRRISVMTPVPNGKPVVKQYNLDEFLKDGKLAANPEIHPGEAVLFGEPRGLTIGAAGQIISSLILIQAASGGKVP